MRNKVIYQGKINLINGLFLSENKVTATSVLCNVSETAVTNVFCTESIATGTEVYHLYWW